MIGKVLNEALRPVTAYLVGLSLAALAVWFFVDALWLAFWFSVGGMIVAFEISKATVRVSRRCSATISDLDDSRQ